ncbi:MAG: TolC family protein [Bacteroidales bacterium]|nr:TolC family protein [Bacteroidales bacterium]
MKNKYLLIISFLFYSGIICSQQKLSLQDCRELALEHNIKNKISREKLELSKLDVNIYKSNFFPKLSLSGNYLYSNTSFNRIIEGGFLPTFTPDASGNMLPNGGAAYMPDIPLELNVKSVFNTSLIVSQPIFSGGKISSAYKMAQIGNNMAKLAQELSMEEVLVMSDQAYWNTVKTIQLVNTAKKYLEALNELERIVDNAVNEGIAHNKDLLSVQVKLNEAILNLARSKNAYQLSIMNLNHIIGLPLENNTSINDNFDICPIGNEGDINIHVRPDFKLLENQVLLDIQGERIAKSEMLPQIGLAGLYSYTNGFELNGQRLLDGGNISALLTVKIPLFGWGEARDNLKKARLKTNISNHNKEDLTGKMKLEATMNYNKVKESLLEIELTTKMVTKAEANMMVSKERYLSGMETLASYLEAQTLWYKSNAELISAKANLNMNITNYLKSSGQLQDFLRSFKISL